MGSLPVFFLFLLFPVLKRGGPGVPCLFRIVLGGGGAGKGEEELSEIWREGSYEWQALGAKRKRPEASKKESKAKPPRVFG